MQAPGRYQWEAGNLNPEEWEKWVGKLRKGAYVPHMKNPFSCKLPNRFKEFLARSVEPLKDAAELTRAEMRKIVDEYIVKAHGVTPLRVFVKLDESLARLFGFSVDSEVYIKDIDAIMDGMFTDEKDNSCTHVAPAVRVGESSVAYMIAVDLVGCKREHITASVIDGNRLHVQARRVFPSLEGGPDLEPLHYVLCHELPFECKKAPASLFADGVLTLTFDKEAMYQSIPIVIG